MKQAEENQLIIYNTDDGKARVTLYAKDGNVWMNQSQIAELFDTSIPNEICRRHYSFITPCYASEASLVSFSPKGICM